MAVSQYASGSSGTGFTFPGHHSAPLSAPPELTLNVHQFPGIVGESHHLSGPYGRTLQVQIEMTGYATQALLQAALDANDAQVGVLLGQVTIGSTTFAECTFLGFTPERAPFYDPHNGWTIFGRLDWKQRSFNA